MSGSTLAPDQDAALVELNRLLDRWLLWWRTRHALAWAVRGGIAGLAAGLGAGLWLLLQAVLLRAEFGVLVAAAALLGLMIGAGAGFAWPLDRLASARAFDRQFGLQERVSTALELAEAAAGRGDLGRQQLLDALLAARRVDARRSAPVRIPRWEVILALALAGGVLLSLVAGGPRFRAAQQQWERQADIAEEEDRLEALVSRIRSAGQPAADPALDPAQIEALAAPLETARQTLEQSQAAAQAVAALTEAEGELRRLVDPQAQALAEGLRQAGQRLNPAPGSALEAIAGQLARGEMGRAARSLGGIDPDRLSPAEQAELARQLDSLSASLGELDPALSRQLGQAASQLRAGETQAARRSLAGAAQGLEAAAGQAAQAEQAQAAADQVAAGRQRLLQSAAGGGQLAGSAETQPGQAVGGNQDGAGQAGDGAGRGEGEGQEPQGGSSAPGANNGPGDGDESAYAPLFPPQRLGQGEGVTIPLPASGQPGDQAVGQGGTSPGQEAGSRVPYTEVYAAYAQTYRQAIENGQVPPTFREIVRQYFSSLEP